MKGLRSICVVITSLIVLAAGVCSAGYLEIGEVTKTARTIRISPVGTDTANGLALLSALDSITDNSSSNPYLIKIEPGVYDVGSDRVEMKSYVDIEGSGRNVTIIKGSGVAGVVVGADSSDLRSLCILAERAAGSGNLWGIYINEDDMRITDVSIEVKGGTDSRGIHINYLSTPVIQNVKIYAEKASNTVTGISVVNSFPHIRYVDIDAHQAGSKSYGISSTGDSWVKLMSVNVDSDTYGLENRTASVIYMTDCYIESNSYGVLNSGDPYAGGKVEIDRSTVIGTLSSVRNDNALVSFFVGGSKIVGPAGNNVTCINVYNGNYSAVDETCDY
jgi:hypothetical protein